jgi:hypothetical protein
LNLTLDAAGTRIRRLDGLSLVRSATGLIGLFAATATVGREQKKKRYQ